MRTFFFFLLLLGGRALSAQEPGCAGKAADLRVDSLFAEKFQRLRAAVGRDSVLVRDDIRFVYLLGFLTGMGKDMQGYAGAMAPVTKKDLKRWKKWYKRKKCKIGWEQHIQQGITTLENFAGAKSLEEIERLEKALDGLRIK